MPQFRLISETKGSSLKKVPLQGGVGYNTLKTRKGRIGPLGGILDKTVFISFDLKISDFSVRYTELGAVGRV